MNFYDFELLFHFSLIVSDLILFAEISRDSGCRSQAVVKWKRRQLACITFNFAICRCYWSAYVLAFILHWLPWSLEFNLTKIERISEWTCYLQLHRARLNQVVIWLDVFHWQILGADSGWQPVPLTEVITAAAVKRAYRKATLCVHPDKLQQRGASIHQKYICEKVFDLLKVRQAQLSVCALSDF